MLNYTARGFGDSCGSVASRTAAPERLRPRLGPPGGLPLRGARLAVPRRPARPTRASWRRARSASTGGSYGGGQSLILATLRDRVRLQQRQVRDRGAARTASGWRSPRPRRTIPWSDLVHSLTPNGGTLDTEVTSPTDDLVPLGIMKLSYQNILYGSGMATGFYSPKGVDPGAT